MQKPNKLSTSLVVDFGGDGNTPGVLRLEIDDDEDGLNGGNTSFVPGDTVGYKLFKSKNVTVNYHDTSYMPPQPAGAKAGVPQKEIVTFIDSKTATPRYPIDSGFTYRWLGKNPGTLEAVSDSEVVLRVPKVPPGAKVPEVLGVALLTYNTSFELYTMTSPSSLGGVDEFEIAVFVKGIANPPALE